MQILSEPVITACSVIISRDLDIQEFQKWQNIYIIPIRPKLQLYRNWNWKSSQISKLLFKILFPKFCQNIQNGIYNIKIFMSREVFQQCNHS